MVLQLRLQLERLAAAVAVERLVAVPPLLVSCQDSLCLEQSSHWWHFTLSSFGDLARLILASPCWIFILFENIEVVDLDVISPKAYRRLMKTLN